jgi:hypothetical protein
VLCIKSCLSKWFTQLISLLTWDVLMSVLTSRDYLVLLQPSVHCLTALCCCGHVNQCHYRWVRAMGWPPTPSPHYRNRGEGLAYWAGLT